MSKLIEKRAAKIAALEAKQAEDLAKARVCAALDAARAFVRKGNWNRAALLLDDTRRAVGVYDVGAADG